MTEVATYAPPKLYRLTDRPAWIPPEVGDDWDPNPYAYQTEEELMPAGYYHNLYIALIRDLLETYVNEQRLVLTSDVFIIYRDQQGIQRRIAPDIFFVRQQDVNMEHTAAYWLDAQPGPPLCIIELVSPTSRKKDLVDLCVLYAEWGVQEYLVLELLDRKGRLFSVDHVQSTMWRLYGKRYLLVAPDAEGYLHLESIGVKIRIIAENLRPEIRVIATNELLLTKKEEIQLKQQEAQLKQAAEARAQQEAQLRQAAEARAQQEAQLRQQEAQLRQAAEARAQQEAQLRQQEAQLRQQEAQLRQAAEARAQELEEELQRLRAQSASTRKDETHD